MQKDKNVKERRQHNKYRLLLKFWEMHEEDKEIEIDYSDPEKNMALYQRLLDNLEYRNLHRGEEQDQLHNTIAQLQGEIADLGRYQEEAEKTLTLAEMHEKRMDTLKTQGA